MNLVERQPWRWLQTSVNLEREGGRPAKWDRTLAGYKCADAPLKTFNRNDQDGWNRRQHLNRRWSYQRLDGHLWWCCVDFQVQFFLGLRRSCSGTNSSWFICSWNRNSEIVRNFAQMQKAQREFEWRLWRNQIQRSWRKLQFLRPLSKSTSFFFLYSIPVLLTIMSDSLDQHFWMSITRLPWWSHILEAGETWNFEWMDLSNQKSPSHQTNSQQS